MPMVFTATPVAIQSLLALQAPPQLATWRSQVLSDIQFIGDVNAAGHDPLNIHNWAWPSNTTLVGGDWCYDGVDWWKTTQDGTTGGSAPGFAASLVSLTATPNNTTTMTMASTAGLANGMTCSGQGIKPGTTIVSFVANTSVTLSDTATTGGSGTYIFGPAALSDGTTAWQHIFRITLNFLDTVWGDGAGSGYSFGGSQSWVRWGKGKSGSGAGTYSYYDLGMTAWAWSDYLTRTGYGTASQAKLAQSVANQYVDDYLGVHFEYPSIANYSSVWWLFMDGLVEDLKRTTNRYRFNSTVTTTHLKAIQDANASYGPGTCPTWNVQSGAFFNQWYWNQDAIRENGYTTLAYILQNSAGYSYAGNVGDNYPAFTLDGVTDSCMRWMIPALAERLHGAMTTTQVTIPCVLNGTTTVTTTSSVSGIYAGVSYATSSPGAAVTGTNIPATTNVANNGITVGSPNTIVLTNAATGSGTQNLTFYVRGMTNNALDPAINGGWQPFYNGVAIIYPLIRWIEVETAASRDPNRFWNDASIGSTPQFTFTWSKTVPHGACRKWPTIFACIEDYCYWLRNTATSQAGDPMYRATDKGYLLQWTSAGGSSASTDLNQLATVGFTWVAQQMVNGTSGYTGVSPYSYVQWADDSFDGMMTGVGGVGPFRDRVYNSGSNGGCYIPGKQFNERNKFAMTQYLARRNALSGRND